MNGLQQSDSPARPSPWLLAPVAAVVGLAAFGFSCLFMTPHGAVWNYGVEFAAMSEQPFAGIGRFPHRVFGPALAYVLGLHGDRYWIFAHAAVVAFLALVFAVARWRGCSAAGAALLAFVVSVTGAVEVYKGSVGYPEPIAFSLLLASMLATRRTAWFWTIQFLCLANHEEVLFLWPWLLWLKWRDGGLRRADAVGGAIVVAAYSLLRLLMLRNAAKDAQTVGFYAEDLQLSLATPGMWVLVAVAIVVFFGALPALWAWHAWFDGWRRGGAGTCLLMAAVFAMSSFAVDIQRFTGFLVLPVVFAGIRLLQQPRGIVVLGVLGVVTAASMLAQRDVVRFIIETMIRHEPEPMLKIVTVIVPEQWPLFCGYAAAYVAMVLAGRWYAQRGSIRTAASA